MSGYSDIGVRRLGADPRLARAGRVARSGLSRLWQLDWILILAVTALSVTGAVLVWAATKPVLLAAGLGPDYYLKRQLIFIVLGLITMVVVGLLDYRQLRAFAPWVYVLSCLGLLAVLSPLGTVVNGARSWIALPGGFEIEPSEYAKIAVVLVCAMVVGELRPGRKRPRLRAVLLALIWSAIPVALVVKQPDIGVAVLLLAMIFGLIGLSGIRLPWLIGLVAIGVGGLYGVLKLHVLKAYQANRITSFLHPSADPRGTGYSAYQSKIVIGSGGVHGQHLFHSQLVAGNFVPEQHTDFIFAVAGNELGFVGVTVILALLGLVLLRALRIAWKADNLFGMLVAAGVAIWFAVQSFINIGMTMGLTPVTGLPLPFVSYGGSALFADMIAVGMLQAVHRHRRLFGLRLRRVLPAFGQTPRPIPPRRTAAPDPASTPARSR